MAAKTRILLDLNVILDTLQKREPYFLPMMQYELSSSVAGSLENPDTAWIAENPACWSSPVSCPMV